MTPRAVVYLRVSTDDQSTGLEVQRAACRRWVEAQELEVGPEWVDEGRGGSLPPEKRAGLLSALGALGKGDVLVIHKRDRLARDVVVAGMVEALAKKAGATIACADGTPNGDSPGEWLARAMQDVFAQYEVMLIRLRTALALQRKKAKGRCIGGKTPYGWRRRGCMMEQHPEEQVGRLRILTLRAQGLSYRKIIDCMEEEGHPARSGTWHVSTIQRVLEYEPAKVET